MIARWLSTHGRSNVSGRILGFCHKALSLQVTLARHATGPWSFRSVRIWSIWALAWRIGYYLNRDVRHVSCGSKTKQKCTEVRLLMVSAFRQNPLLPTEGRALSGESK